MNPQSEEIAYLKRLIEDFPADVKPGDARSALNKIAARYQVIEQSYQALSLTEFEVQSFGTDLNSLHKFRICVLHEYLFNGILANAGNFRKSSDPRGEILASAD